MKTISILLSIILVGTLLAILPMSNARMAGPTGEIRGKPDGTKEIHSSPLKISQSEQKDQGILTTTWDRISNTFFGKKAVNPQEENKDESLQQSIPFKKHYRGMQETSNDQDTKSGKGSPFVKMLPPEKIRPHY